MSRLLVALLLCLALLRPVGQLVVALARVGLARREACAVPNGIHSPAASTVFVFARSEWQRRARGRREFWYAGRLYDCQRAENIGRDSVRVAAWPDDHEREALAGLRAFFYRDASPATSRPQVPAAGPVQLLIQPFLVDEPPACPAPPGTEDFSPDRPATAAHRPAAVFGDTFSPPPERG